MSCKDKTSIWHLIGFPDGSNIYLVGFFSCFFVDVGPDQGSLLDSGSLAFFLFFCF